MPRLCLVTALPAESRPLLDALKLKQHNARHLKLYSSDSFFLLETGVGKLNAAASIGAVLQFDKDITGIVNIGIAGGLFNYSQVLIAHHILDSATGAQWYPHLPAHPSLRQLTSASVQTVDQPSTRYLENTVFDMEAAGVYAAASSYLPGSCIHSIKIVSDNPENSIDHIDKKAVLNLFMHTLPTILPALEALREHTLSLQYQQPEAVSKLIEHTLCNVHHSKNDEQLLRELVQRHWNLCGRLPVLETNNTSARNIRRSLLDTLDTLPLLYGQ